jgi:hypothetical protein
MIALMVEVASTSETSVEFYESTRSNIPEDSHFHTRRRKNMKSRIKLGHDRFLLYPFQFIIH